MSNLEQIVARLQPSFDRHQEAWHRAGVVTDRLHSTMAAKSFGSMDQAAPAIKARREAPAVAARINGREVRLQIVEGDMAAFEGAHGSAYAMLARLSSGNWKLADVGVVLSFAALSDELRAGAWLMTKMAGGMGPETAIGVPLRELIGDRPAALYAPLAIALLSGALFGHDEASLQFSDEAV